MKKQIEEEIPEYVDGFAILMMLFFVLIGIMIGKTGYPLTGLLVTMVFGLALGIMLIPDDIRTGIFVSGLIVAVSGFMIMIHLQNTSFLLINSIQSIIFLIIIFLILVELIFLFEHNKPKKKEDKFIFTFKRKLIISTNIIITFFITNEILFIVRQIISKNYIPEILKGIINFESYLGITLMILFSMYIWIKLNSLKFKK